MACFERASPSLKNILLQLYRAEKAIEIDHHLHEFGSVEYHIQSSVSDPRHAYLSISTPFLSQRDLLSYGLSYYTMEMVKGIATDVVEIVEPAKEGYQLTLRLNFAKIPCDSVKVITDISTVQATILSSQLKEMLWNVNSGAASQGIYQPIKITYHPREPFYVIKQPQKIMAVFPMRFKEHSDVIIATAFFQELMDVGSSEKWAKAPPCCWSPIPPPELRGETIEDLSTNGGFVTFDISQHHIEGKRLDKTVWNLLNFYAYVKYHVKCTKGFIQRRMRKRLESLVEILQKANLPEEEHTGRAGRVKVNTRTRYVRKLVRLPKSKGLRRRCSEFTRKIKRIRFRIKIRGFRCFRKRWLTSPTSSSMRYTRLE
ncbi:actin-related protein 2/3 complex subunit 2B isoform X4 [Pistacia vera]|uniref:actin-related protein 2/3 complex subunit 2B isoform X3 n=1 Tax=Pistacia vera TaxID=55513 RepID=UPI001262DF7D|nr:actin-related protein 2/3 complex subunit 2B isoform X3 [Pistacia vera]XP_031276643.1 actin-related protein 2/3 complex subunit 2B isoform X4 [Pistacia vera]